MADDNIYMVQNTVYNMATGAKTILNVIAGANQSIKVLQWCVTFDGVTSSAIPAGVEFCQSTQATAGTPGSSPPAIVQASGRVSTPQFTNAHNYTAEPTALTILEPYYVPAYMGGVQQSYPLGCEPETDLSGGTVKALCIRINTTATVNARAWMRVAVGA